MSWGRKDNLKSAVLIEVFTVTFNNHLTLKFLKKNNLEGRQHNFSWRNSRAVLFGSLRCRNSSISPLDQTIFCDIWRRPHLNGSYVSDKEGTWQSAAVSDLSEQFL